MSESKLQTQSMDFAVSIINLVKDLKLKKESIISIKSAEAALPSVPISAKHSMPTERRILLRSCKLH